MTRPEVRAVEAGALAGRPLRYFDYVMAAFVTILLLSNVIGAGKLATVDLPGIGPWIFGAGILDVYDSDTDFTPFRAKV